MKIGRWIDCPRAFRRQTLTGTFGTVKIIKNSGILCIMIVTVMFSACSPGPKVKITNNSSQTISNMVVSGAGFSVPIAEVGANSSVSVVVRPRGESTLTIRFIADGKHFESKEDLYFEDSSMYWVEVAIAADLSISSESGLR